MRQIVVIAHDIRSTHNVGALLRTCEGLGVSKLYMTGYTPYPGVEKDSRLPHIVRKLESQIHKTALGAEKTLPWEKRDDITSLLYDLQDQHFMVVALEQSEDAVALPDFVPPNKVALLIGREVEGIDESLLKLSDEIVQIPMFGKKESFNVVEATSMALYQLRFSDK